MALPARPNGPAAAYVLNRFRRAIDADGEPGSRTAILLGGGAASGKTTSIGADVIGEHDLVFDSNFADPQKAAMLIDAAVAGRVTRAATP